MYTVRSVAASVLLIWILLTAADLVAQENPVSLRDRRSAIYSAPIVTSDTVYFAASDGNVYALESTNGKLRWKFKPSAASELFTSPATDGTRIFVKSRRKADKLGENAVFAIASSHNEE